MERPNYFIIVSLASPLDFIKGKMVTKYVAEIDLLHKQQEN